MAHPQSKPSPSDRKPPVHIGRPCRSYTAGSGEREWRGDINKAPHMPIKMKRIVLELGLTTSMIAKKVRWEDGRPVSKSAISNTLNKGYVAPTVPNYTKQFEDMLREFNVAEDVIATIWEPEDTAQIIPIGTQPAKRNIEAEEETELFKEKQMLTPTTKHHFKMFRDPFDNEIKSPGDMYMSESHRYAEAAMLDAAMHTGFVAICGPVGAGKTTVRERVVEALNEGGECRVIAPQIVDKAGLRSEHIMDAIILDLDQDAKIKNGRERKARQVADMLRAGSRAGLHYVLMIEEAHDIPIQTLKQLKRLLEIKDGMGRILGIVLVGQRELTNKLDMRYHPEISEVIQRCFVYRLTPMSKTDCENYIDFKFSNIGREAAGILADGCVDEIMTRLDLRGESVVYPLAVNNILTMAMNATAQVGAPQVTPAIIKEV